VAKRGWHSVAAVNVTYTANTKKAQLKLKIVEKKISPEGLNVFFMAGGVQYLQERARIRFKMNGRDVGGWEPLSPYTQARRKTEGYTPIKINRRTGEMRDWVEMAPGYVISAAKQGAASLMWPKSSGNKYLEDKLRTAQFGSQKTTGSKRVVTPARPVLAVTPKDLLAFGKMLNSYIKSELG
jgi:hypothetical protein